jgi:hypothetical protein
MSRLFAAAGLVVAVLASGCELDAEVSGAGDIEYHGDPAVREDVSGLGDVERAR